MATTLLFSLAAGALLAMRFRVWVLLPVMAAALPLAIAVGIFQHLSFVAIVLLLAATLAVLQIGYLASLMLRNW